MTTFDNRDKAFENKFAHDEEMKFKVHARAAKLLGLWAAGKLGKTGTDIDAYALASIEAELAAPHDAALLSKIIGDLDGKVSQKDIEHQWQDLLHLAADQIMQGK